MSTGGPEDYYTLLGIDAGSDAAEVRRAWRRLALRFHPDRAGVAATATFQKILAAYMVLSDPPARAAYDRRRGPPARGPVARAGAVGKAPAGTGSRSAPGVRLHRVSGSLDALLACGTVEWAEDGDVLELLLSAQEASDGGMATISMRVPVRCPQCDPGLPKPCPRCGTTRTVEEVFSAWLAIPPGVSAGTVLTPSALFPGMVRPLSFRVRLPATT